MYAEALERQVHFLRWVDGGGFQSYVAAAVGRYDKLDDTPTRQWFDGFRHHLSLALRQGETFYWGPDLMPLLLTGGTLPPATQLTATDLPAPQGYIWFPRALRVRSEGFAEMWRGTSDRAAPDGSEESDIIALSWDANPETVALQTWIRPVDPRLWRDGKFAAGLPLHAWPMPGFWRFSKDLAANVRPDGKTEAHHRLELAGESVGPRLFATCVLFLAQAVVRTEAAPPFARHERRRLEQDGWTRPPVVRVVRLRRIETRQRAEDSPAPVDWSCQWVVRGHWRQQPCGPKKSERRTTWVMPYTKGPEDKPLRPPRATVFAVVR